MEKLLTVSVAAYNVAPYIAQTLDSCILAPEWMDRLEVLIVDDGAADDTAAIAQSYADRYPGTFRVIRKPNGGYGTTVNRSMREAAGRYFKLLDGDDWFDQNGLLALLRHLEHTQADAVLTHIRRFTPDGELTTGEPTWSRYYGRSMNAEEVTGEILITMWQLTYRTELLRAHPFTLPEHTLYTDQLFVVYPLPYVRRLDFLPDRVYCYRLGRDGQSVSRENRIRHYAEAVSNMERMLEYYCQLPPDLPTRHLVEERLQGYYRNAVKTLLLLPASRENLGRILALEKLVKTRTPALYPLFGAYSRKIVGLLRSTAYLAYWPLAWKGLPNWD